MTEPEWTHPEVEFGAAERLTFFSDAVVAIAITLLALELPVPTGFSMRELLDSFGANRDSYLAFVISFIVIARHWAGHHRIFRYLLRMDDQLRAANMLWLLTMIITPFVTKVISGDDSSDHPSEVDTSMPLRFAIYAAVQVLSNLSFLWMLHHMIAARLLREDTPAVRIQRAYWQIGALAIAFGLSIPVFFVFDSAWILWIVIPVGAGFWGRARRKRHLGAHEIH